VTDGGGLVDIAISAASLSCAATVPSAGATQTYTSTASVTGAVSYWKYNSATGTSSRVTVPLSATLTGGADPLSAVALTTPVSSTRTLGTYISSWSSTQSVLQDTNTGLFQVPGVVNITTQPVRSGDATSSVGLEAGNLACAASDDR
jgi:hypothetical protein